MLEAEKTVISKFSTPKIGISMKKCVLISILASFILLALGACGGSDSSDSSGSSGGSGGSAEHKSEARLDNLIVAMKKMSMLTTLNIYTQAVIAMPIKGTPEYDYLSKGVDETFQKIIKNKAEHAKLIEKECTVDEKKSLDLFISCLNKIEKVKDIEKCPDPVFDENSKCGKVFENIIDSIKK